MNLLRKTFGVDQKKKEKEKGRQIKLCEGFGFTETVRWGPTLQGEIIRSRRINSKNTLNAR